MSRGPLIIPTILARTPEAALERLYAALQRFDYVQIDIMDGKFVPSKTPELVELYRGKAKGKYAEVHLMVERSDEHALRWAAEEYVGRVLPHVESFRADAFAMVRKVTRDHGVELGMALNPATQLETILPWVDELDAVLLMTVVPGFDGSPFVPEVLEKIKQLHALKPELPIEVDGGVSLKTIPSLADAGVARYAVGSALFSAPDIDSAAQELQQAAEKAYTMRN